MARVRNLFYIRKQRGLTLTELARRVQEHDRRAGGRTALSEFENCRHDTSQRTLQALSAVLGVGVDDLLEERDAAVKPRGRGASFATTAGGAG